MVLWTLREIQYFPLVVHSFWLEFSWIRRRSGEPFDYIFPLDYFYSHNTAHWQNCSPLLYFRPLIFWFLVGLARQARPKLRSICSLHGQQPSQQPPRVKNKLSSVSCFFTARPTACFILLQLTFSELSDTLHMLRWPWYFSVFYRTVVKHTNSRALLFTMRNFCAQKQLWPTQKVKMYSI